MQGLYEYSGQAVRVFGILIALLIMVVETEWQGFLWLVPLLDSWVGRAVLQVRRAGRCAKGSGGGGMFLGVEHGSG